MRAITNCEHTEFEQTWFGVDGQRVWCPPCQRVRHVREAYVEPVPTVYVYLCGEEECRGEPYLLTMSEITEHWESHHYHLTDDEVDSMVRGQYEDALADEEQWAMDVHNLRFSDKT